MQTILYLGIDPPSDTNTIHYHHYPLIRTQPRSPHSIEIQESFVKMEEYTHLIFTSKQAVRYFSSLISYKADLVNKTFIAVGKKTAQSIQNAGFLPTYIAKTETAEGLIDLLLTLPIEQAFFFWPHSSLSRPTLPLFFQKSHIRYKEVVLYDTHFQLPGPLPKLEHIDAILFTSPSTVEAYLHFFGSLPKDKQLIPIGPITAAKLKSQLEKK
jgi:uroporphyrinogen-III synthase